MKSILLLLAATLFIAKAPAQLMDDLSLKYLVQLPTEQASHARAIILLHGYGSNEDDLFGLRSSLPKNCFIISARAPIPIGPNAYEWYAIDGHNKAAQTDSSRTLIIRFIREIIKKYTTNKCEIFVVGFSQGALMAYEVGLTHPYLINGIGVLSGKLNPSVLIFGYNYGFKHIPQRNKLKVFIGHGTADERIKFQEGKDAVDWLEKAGLHPEFHAYKGMGHAISNDEMRDLVKWLH